MQEEKNNQQASSQEKELLSALYKAEDLAEKKARIYSKLLTEIPLAQEMEELADRHATRKQLLYSLLTGGNSQKDGGMSATNEQGGEQ